MGKLYLHLGLHKTATTAMQTQVFPNIKGVVYLHRDVFNKDSLYNQIARYCFSRAANAKLASKIIARLRVMLINSDVLISEEWFTSDFSYFYRFEGASWQEKIRRLSYITNEFEKTILITTREPVSGLFSLYCEFGKVGLYKKHPTFESFLSHSNDAQCFDLVYLSNFLTELFGQAPIMLPYEYLKSRPDYYFVELGQWLGRNLSPFSDKLVKENATVYSGDSVIILTPGIKLIIFSKLVRMFPDYLLSVTKKVPIIRTLKAKFVDQSVESRDIGIPEQNDIEAIKLRFAASIEFYENLDN